MLSIDEWLLKVAIDNGLTIDQLQPSQKPPHKKEGAKDGTTKKEMDGTPLRISGADIY